MDSLLTEVLAGARDAGFLGPGPIEHQLAHARAFAGACLRQGAEDGTSEHRVADLGSGGGLPGLVLAVEWPEARVVLIEANGRRASFLRRAVARLELGGRVTVEQRRAEACGRDEAMRAAFDGVVARSFGPPAVTAECAAPLLRVGGWLVVSEPPAGELGSGRGRWPTDGLAQLGLEPVGTRGSEFVFQVVRQRELCPARFPRRDGVPAKRPLF